MMIKLSKVKRLYISCLNVKLETDNSKKLLDNQIQSVGQNSHFRNLYPCKEASSRIYRPNSDTCIFFCDFFTNPSLMVTLNHNKMGHWLKRITEFFVGDAFETEKNISTESSEA